MFVMTYTNTFKNNKFKNDEEQTETKTTKVLVLSEVEGKKLLKVWQHNSDRHARGKYNYAFVSIRPATKTEVKKMDLYAPVDLVGVTC